jgi:glucose-6-phosphate-specific signal transduction histidine kinase
MCHTGSRRGHRTTERAGPRVEYVAPAGLIRTGSVKRSGDCFAEILASSGYILDFWEEFTVVFGMSLATYTLLHVIISVIAIGSGLMVMYGFLKSKRWDGLTAIFLITTILTSVSGFGFPFEHLLPSHKVGIISLVVLAVALAARYAFHMAGAWRKIYVITAAMALYFNVFVLVVQAFLKQPALHALAPEGKEPPFLIAQIIVMVIFIVLTIFAVKKFHPELARA